MILKSWGAVILSKYFPKNLRGRLFCAKIFGRFAPVFVDFTSKNCRHLNFSNTEKSKFWALRAHFFSSQGARVSNVFSKSEKSWGALILNEKSPEMAGGGGYLH